MSKILRNPVAGYFADSVMSDIAKYNYEYSEDLIVQTSLDLTTQIHADKILNTYLTTYGSERHISQGAILIMDKDGYVKALIGGADYKQS